MGPNLITIDYHDLLDNEMPTTVTTTSAAGPSPPQQREKQAQLQQNLEDAFGPHGLGIIAIRHVPGLIEARKALFFPMAHSLAHLPSDYLEEHLTDATSLYNVGWSRGKEMLTNGQPDLSKGSFYYCPTSDTPGSPEERAKYPLSYPTNKWPPRTTINNNNNNNTSMDDNADSTLNVLPGFEDAAKHLGTLLKQVVVLVARQLDMYCLKRVSGYVANTLYNALHDTPKVKARLLYYYPQKQCEKDQQQQQQLDNGSVSVDHVSGAIAPTSSTKNATLPPPWIGWHNDSGFLTALAGESYVDDSTGEEIVDKAVIPEGAGLYVATSTAAASHANTLITTPTSEDRQGNVRTLEHHIVLPPDCMAVQIGECTQIISGGVLVATPHAVLSGKSIQNNHAATAYDSSNNDNVLAKQCVARISLACFVDTPPPFQLSPPIGCTREDVLQASHPHPQVPPLSQRWTRPDMAFGDFLKDTFAMYYQSQQEQQKSAALPT